MKFLNRFVPLMVANLALFSPLVEAKKKKKHKHRTHRPSMAPSVMAPQPVDLVSQSENEQARSAAKRESEDTNMSVTCIPCLKTH